MKKSRLITSLCFLFLGIVGTNACEITLKILGDTKESYQVGDELIIEVNLYFTHHTCPVSVKETKFQYQGVEILGATDWKKISDMKFTRKLKVKVVEIQPDKKNKTQITAVRSCHKEGGMGSIEIKRN